MSQKKITELQLLTALTDGLLFGADNGQQTYRVSLSSITDYVNQAIQTQLDTIKSNDWVTTARILNGAVGLSKLGSDVKITVDNKFLDATVGGNSSNIASLRITNAPANHKCLIVFTVDMQADGGSMQAIVNHDGNVVARARIVEGLSASGYIRSFFTSMSWMFDINNSNITVDTTDMGSNDFLFSSTRLTAIYFPNELINLI